MTKRLPRKRKKQIKKIVAVKSALKCVFAAIVSAQSMARVSAVLATPFNPVPDKVMSVVEITKYTACAIGNIMGEPPNSWREFIR